MTTNNSRFSDLGIAPDLMKVVDGLRYSAPTPIQRKAIPIGVEGKDVIGVAQTGTGKTLAFGIPMVQGLSRSRMKGLVLLPTRELAVQVNETIAKLERPFRLGSAVLIGGESVRNQVQRLRARPRILIATPGRLNDLIEQGIVRMDDVGVVVLDEADRMLDMGFYPQIERILRLIPRGRQTMLFSATMAPEVLKIATAHMRIPIRVEIAPSGSMAENISQEMFVVRRETKSRMLVELLKQYAGSVLIFVRTRRAAHKVAAALRLERHAVSEIHADRSLAQRQAALAAFKSGRARIMVATDIAARGIDVIGIELVVNYDLPDDPENYVHRIGRTARAGKSGHAISLATPDQGQDVRRIEGIIRMSIPKSEHPDVPTERLVPERPAGFTSHVRSFGRLGRRRR